MSFLCLRKWAGSGCKQTYFCDSSGRRTPDTTTWLPPGKKNSWTHQQTMCRPNIDNLFILSKDNSRPTQKSPSWCCTYAGGAETLGLLRAPLRCHLVATWCNHPAITMRRGAECTNIAFHLDGPCYSASTGGQMKSNHTAPKQTLPTCWLEFIQSAPDVTAEFQNEKKKSPKVRAEQTVLALKNTFSKWSLQLYCTFCCRYSGKCISTFIKFGHGNQISLWNNSDREVFFIVLSY